MYGVSGTYGTAKRIEIEREIKMLALTPQEESAIFAAVKQGELLFKKISFLHTAACLGNPLLELLIRDMYREVNNIRNRLTEIGNLIPASKDADNDFPAFEGESN